uniref:D-3-phosphoglycerate dehydrogenase n=1 Tax=Picocystis salinarum TaxID=88271 RepID=A0A7S3UDP2_9CHLO
MAAIAQHTMQQTKGFAARRHAGNRIVMRRTTNGPLLRRALVCRASQESRPTVLIPEKLGDAGLNLLRRSCNVDCSYDLSPEDLKAKISLCDAIIVRSGTKVTREVFEASKGRLRVVGRAGVGIDNVDLQAATELGCLVVNAPTANTVAAAEHGVALLCALARNVAQADASMKEGKWARTKYVGVSLVDKTLAVMGFGKVGSEVARRAKGLGMKVIAHDPYASADRARAIGVELVSFDEALGRGDFFSLHMPLTDSTKGIFNKAAFAKMKKGARIVNVARGEVINEADLAVALEEGTVAQAALDVFCSEPPEEGNPLVNRPDVVCTPHLGASTVEAQEGVAVEIAEAVLGALNGELAATAVNAPMVAADVLEELRPYVALADRLGRIAVQLCVGGMNSVKLSYASPRSDDLDTRLLRAMAIKGLIEPTTTSIINLVNADFTAKKRGLKIVEESVPAEGSEVLKKITLTVKSNSKFTGAVNAAGEIELAGEVVNGVPYLTKVGDNMVEVALVGSLLLGRQQDRPGMIGQVGTILGSAGVNISFMTVARTAAGEALVALGVDETPDHAILEKVMAIPSIEEVTFIDM